MGVLFADGTEAADDFVMVQGDDAFIDITVLDEDTKLVRDITGYDEIIWVLNLGETQITKSKTLGSITVEDSNTFRVAITAVETDPLYGLYSFQSTLVSVEGQRETVIDGTMKVTRRNHNGG